MFQLVKRQQRMWKETWTIERFCYVLHFNSTTKVGQPVLAFDLVVVSWLLRRFNHMNLICWWYCSDSWQIWEWSTPQHGIVCCQRSWTWFFTIQAWITNQEIYNASTILIKNPHKSGLKPGNTTTFTSFSSLWLAPRTKTSTAWFIPDAGRSNWKLVKDRKVGNLDNMGRTPVIISWKHDHVSTFLVLAILYSTCFLLMGYLHMLPTR